jgi:hypothetical protein
MTILTQIPFVAIAGLSFSEYTPTAGLKFLRMKSSAENAADD